jgi:hypothetical protein
MIKLMVVQQLMEGKMGEGRIYGCDKMIINNKARNVGFLFGTKEINFKHNLKIAIKFSNNPRNGKFY